MTLQPNANQTPAEGRIWSASFLGLLLTQFLTAVNDNIFRWLVIGIGKDFVDPPQYGNVLMAGTACFVLPYLLLAAPAGFFADRFSKRTVIIGCKVAEIGIMALGVVAITMEQLESLFVVVALMGAQSTLFSPAKLGSIPEMLPSSQISAANGLFGLMTVVATLVGMVAGNVLKDFSGLRGTENWWPSAVVLIGVAAAGTAISLLIRRLPVANPDRQFAWKYLLFFPYFLTLQTFRDLRALASNRALLRVALGMVFFWSVGALAQLNIDQLAYESGAQGETDKVPLLVALIIGVGIGSVLAGIWSAGHVELGILPLGAAGMAIGGMLLLTVPPTIFTDELTLTLGCVWACLLLFGLGLSAGMFDVPLEAYMQHRSPVESRGSILAAANFMTFSGILLAALLFSGLRFPLDAGSLQNVSQLQSIRLNEQQRNELRGLEQQFQQALVAGDPEVTIESLTAPLEGDFAQAALGHLLWLELRSRRGGEQAVQREELVKRFPDSAQLVREVYDQAIGQPLFSSRQIFLLVGLGTIPVFIYIVWLIPQASVRFLVWLLSRTLYRIKVHGLEHLPQHGGAMLVPNHVSWLDGFLLLLTSERPVRVVVFAGNFRSRILKRMADSWGAIMITAKPKEIVRALRTAKQALQNGELVCIFPEGGITRSGQIQAFKPGLMKILEGVSVPVVPVYLDGLWGSIFSFKGGKFFWKWPSRWPYPISIYFGAPLYDPEDVHEVRQAVSKLGAEAVKIRMENQSPVTAAFVRQAKRRKWSRKIVDSTGGELTGGQLLMRTLILRRLLRRRVLQDDDTYVGLLLPPSVGGAVTNFAVSLDRRVAVNLNYTVGSDILNACIAQCGMKRVLTSRRFFDKLNARNPLSLDVELVFLEELRDNVTWADKLVSACSAYAAPSSWLIKSLGLDLVKPDDVLTLIFTSGSTGVPKGVMLTQSNIASNVEAIDQVIHLTPDDVLLGILPFFHSLGFTVTLWGVAALDVVGAYHFNPLDAKQVGKLCQQVKATILLSTPTFLRSYLRRCGKDELGTLDVVVAGAEKLPSELCDAFEEKFSVRPVEGYGTTELSPLVAVNIPPSRSIDNFQTDLKEGTVGRPVPGVSARIVDLDSGEELGANQAGMLLIKGPNVMKGYHGRDDLTAEVIQDGWYETGDVAMIDDEGFIRITGRKSRFSKIGGEMVPHIQIEETLTRLIAAPEELGPQAAVTAVPDAKKGERLIVLHTTLEISVDDLRKGLADEGFPPLYIPSADSFLQVDELPVLGTGKIDLKSIKQIALDRFG